jgi:hypothetical protein
MAYHWHHHNGMAWIKSSSSEMWYIVEDGADDLVISLLQQSFVPSLYYYALPNHLISTSYFTFHLRVSSSPLVSSCWCHYGPMRRLLTKCESTNEESHTGRCTNTRLVCAGYHGYYHFLRSIIDNLEGEGRRMALMAYGVTQYFDPSATNLIIVMLSYGWVLCCAVANRLQHFSWRHWLRYQDGWYIELQR